MKLLEALKHSSPERKFTIISKKTGFIYYKETPAAYIEELEDFDTKIISQVNVDGVSTIVI